MRNPLNATLAAISLLAVFASTAFPQGLIIRGGANLTKAVTDPEPASPSNREYRNGLNAALLGEFGNEGVSLLVGAGYENKGMHISGPGGGDIRLDYLTIPMMVSFGTSANTSQPRMFVNAGIESAFLLSSDYATDSYTFSFGNAEDYDFSLRGEFGGEFPISYSGPSLLAGIGYTYALTDANSSGDEWHNYGFHAFVGLKIRTF